MAVASQPVDDVSVRRAGELAFGALPMRVRTCAHRGYGYPHLTAPVISEPTRTPLGDSGKSARTTPPSHGVHKRGSADVALQALDERGVAGQLPQAPAEAAPLRTRSEISVVLGFRDP
jgi:hypothetical protein